MAVDAAASSHDLRTITVTAVLCSLVAVVYVVAQIDPAPAVSLFVSICPLIATILWLQRDAGRTGVAAVHDFGLFLWLAWPVVIPWYAWKTRGISGWRLTVRLFALICAAQVTWFLASWLLPR